VVTTAVVISFDPLTCNSKLPTVPTWNYKFEFREVRVMRLPIDASRLQFLVVGEAEPVRKFEADKPREAWAPRVDDNGELLWRVQLVAFGDGGADILRVVVAGDPGVKEGELVRVEGMTAQAWEMDGRSGMAFRAAAIRPAQAASPRAGGAEKAAA
jgi:hypothetical protein